MKRIFQIVAFVCSFAAANAHAQNLTTVTASSLYKGGTLLPSGQICFTGTDANDNPIPFRVGGGGQEVTYPYCATVTNGAIVGTFQVANPASTAPANINYRVELFDQYNRLQKWAGVQFTGATFNFDNYVPSANLPLGTSTNVATIGNLTVTGSCTGCGGGGGGGGGYSTIQNAGSALAQRATANFFAGITCADNSGQSRTDCQVDQTFSPTWTGTHTFNGTTNIAGTFQISGAAPQGKIPIGNGTSYVPGDPLVQGTQAAGSTTATNPVSIGGYDTSGTPVLRTETVLNGAPAGTEYGFVTRNIPSGTQPVSESTLDGAISGNKVATKSADGDFATIGAKTDAAATQTDTTAVSAISLLKEISKMLQSPAPTPVTGTFWQATQPVSESNLDSAIGTPGSAVPSKAIYTGGDGSGNVSPFLNCDGYAYYDNSTNGLTQLVALTSGKTVYVCGYVLSTSQTTAVHAWLAYGTGSSCGTGTTQMTPKWPLQAVSSSGPIGKAVMTPGFTGLKTAASNALCIDTDAAASVQAEVWYTQF